MKMQEGIRKKTGTAGYQELVDETRSPQSAAKMINDLLLRAGHRKFSVLYAA